MRREVKDQVTLFVGSLTGKYLISELFEKEQVKVLTKENNKEVWDRLEPEFTSGWPKEVMAIQVNLNSTDSIIEKALKWAKKILMSTKGSGDEDEIFYNVPDAVFQAYQLIRQLDSDEESMRVICKDILRRAPYDYPKGEIEYHLYMVTQRVMDARHIFMLSLIHDNLPVEWAAYFK